MTELLSQKFGRVAYRADSVFFFPQGIPAFEHEKEFVPIEDPALAGLIFLQSPRTPELCFLALPVRAVDQGYELEMAADDLAALGMQTRRQPLPGTEVLVLALLCLGGQVPVTANLLAPVVVNLANRRAVQAVRSDTRYSPRQAVPQGAGSWLPAAAC